MPQRKLDKKKKEHYKKVLLGMKEKILRDISSMSQSSGGGVNESSDVSGHVLHMADVATDMYDREFSLGLASTEREVLNKIDDALKRVEEEAFGLCEGCQKPIPKARLDAIPYATTCVQCQEKFENEGR